MKKPHANTFPCTQSNDNTNMKKIENMNDNPNFKHSTKHTTLAIVLRRREHLRRGRRN